MSTQSSNDEQCLWDHSAEGSLTVRTAPGHSGDHGAKTIVPLREDQTEHLEERIIKEIINK